MIYFGRFTGGFKFGSLDVCWRSVIVDTIDVFEVFTGFAVNFRAGCVAIAAEKKK